MLSPNCSEWLIRSFRLFNMLDDYNRQGLGIEVDLSLPSIRVIRSQQQIIEWRGKPIEQVQDSVTRWLWTYKHERPNIALGGIAPMQALNRQMSGRLTLAA